MSKLEQRHRAHTGHKKAAAGRAIAAAASGRGTPELNAGTGAPGATAAPGLER